MKKVTHLFEEKPKKKKPPQKMVKAALKTHSKVRRTEKNPMDSKQSLKTSISKIRIKNMQKAGKEREGLSRGAVREHFENRHNKKEKRLEKTKKIFEKRIKK